MGGAYYCSDPFINVGEVLDETLAVPVPVSEPDFCERGLSGFLGGDGETPARQGSPFASTEGDSEYRVRRRLEAATAGASESAASYASVGSA